VFCKIVKGQSPCFKIFEDSSVLAFADINPITDGHTLLIPKIHFENLWSIEEKELKAIHLASKKVLMAITEVYDPIGVAVLQLNGYGVNQEINHYHLHLIPRHKNGPVIPFADWDLKPGNLKKLGKISNMISARI
jgi:histidine triad (HIT) family protein